MKLDTIKVQVDIAKSKLMVFLAIAGGSWVYGLKENISLIFTVASWVAFVVSSFGVFVNIGKLSRYETEVFKNG